MINEQVKGMAFWSANQAEWLRAFFVNGAYRVAPNADGWTLDQLNNAGGDFKLIAEVEAYHLYSMRYIEPVSEITAERFKDMLEILPPIDWQAGEYVESFKLSEMYCGNVTDIFAKYGDRYFQLRNVVTMPHREIIRLVSEFIGNEKSAA